MFTSKVVADFGKVQVMPERHFVAARLINEAGGTLIGRTRLQKVTCLATLAGLLDTFDFEYRHYGPFSETLAASISVAAELKLIEEIERRAEWGGWYSVYSATAQTPPIADVHRANFLVEASRIGALVLELSATAAFLHVTENLDAEKAWVETAARKPEKAQGNRLEEAKIAYRKLKMIPTPVRLPDI